MDINSKPIEAPKARLPIKSIVGIVDNTVDKQSIIPAQSRIGRLILSGNIGVNDVAGQVVTEKNGRYMRLCKIVTMSNSYGEEWGQKVCGQWVTV